MNALAQWLAPLAEHGASLLLGVTAVLACGLLAMRLHRSVAQRRWLGVTTALALVLYLAVAVAPLPRLQFARTDGDVRVVVPVAIRVPESPRGAAEESTALLAAAFDEFGDDLDADADEPSPASRPRAGSAAGAAFFAAPRDVATRDPAAAPRAPTADASRSREAGVAAAPAPASANVPWSLAFAGLYVLGVLCMLVRTLGGHLRLRTLLARCAPLPAPMLRDVALPHGARACCTERTVRPFCTGFWRPCIVLPRDLLAPARAGEAFAVLRHEVAHVRARDPRVWSLLAWLAVPLWFHPLFWWLCRDVRFCSEVLADDAAAGFAGRQRYAKALIDLAERSTATAVAAGTVAIFHRPSEFYRRIQMLLSRQAPLSTSTSRARRFAQGLSMLLLVGAAASVFGVPAAAQDPAGDPLRRENVDLRATVDTLREELRQLRDEIAALQARTSPKPIDWDTRMVEENAGAGAKPKTSMRGPDPRAVDPVKSDRMRHGLYDTRKKHMEDQVAEEQHIAGTPSVPPAVPEPEVENPGVPVLKDLPILGEMFKSAPAPVATPERLEEVKIGDEFFDLSGRRAVPPVTSAGRYYVVKQGDSLQRIARVELGNLDRVREIITYNPGLDGQRLAVGQQILLPDDEAVLGESGSRHARSPDKGRTTPEPTAGSPVPPAPEDLRVRELLQSKGFAYPPQPAGDPAFAQSSSSVAAISDLTARYLDLQAELELQKVTSQNTKQLVDAGRMSTSDALRATVTLRTIEKKLAIATRLIDGEIAATESELQWLQKRRAEGSPSEGMQIDTELRRAQTRLEALRTVKP